MKRTMTLGMVIPDITNPYFPEVVKGVDSAARAAGFNLILANAGEDALIEWEHLQTLRGLRCDGVVLIPAPRSGDDGRVAAAPGVLSPAAGVRRPAGGLGARRGRLGQPDAPRAMPSATCCGWGTSRSPCSTPRSRSPATATGPRATSRR